MNARNYYAKQAPYSHAAIVIRPAQHSRVGAQSARDTHWGLRC